MPISTELLVKIAGGGFVATTIAYVAFNQKIQSGFRYSEYTMESMKLLQGYPSAEKYLGKPITLRKLDLKHSFHEVNTEMAKVALPVNGPKGKAHVFSWSSRLPGETKPLWRVEQLDLALSNGRRWTFYKNPESQLDMNNSCTDETQSVVK